MRRGPMIAAAAAGVLCANALPHLGTAAAGWRMLTPLAGRDSPAWVNGIWGAANLAGGLVALRAAARDGGEVEARREAFALGTAAFALWSVVGERAFAFNSPPTAPNGHTPPDAPGG